MTEKNDSLDKDSGKVEIDRVEGDVNVSDNSPDTETEAQRDQEQEQADKIADNLREG